MRLSVRRVSAVITQLIEVACADTVVFAQGDHVKRSVTVQLQPLSERFKRLHHSFQQERHRHL